MIKKKKDIRLLNAFLALLLVLGTGYLAGHDDLAADNPIKQVYQRIFGSDPQQAETGTLPPRPWQIRS